MAIIEIQPKLVGSILGSNFGWNNKHQFDISILYEKKNNCRLYDKIKQLTFEFFIKIVTTGKIQMIYKCGKANKR